MSRPITDVIGDLAGGRTMERLTELLQNVVSAVQETGKDGSLQLTLTIKPNGAHGVIVKDAIKAKTPEMDRGDSVFFIDSDGGLHRNDPRQIEMPLRKVEDVG